MKTIIKVATILALILSSSNLNNNSLKAQNNSQGPLSVCEVGSGRILSLNLGLKSGLLLDDVTGNIKEFHYAGLEVLEVNTDYVYIVQVTVSGKIIIRDIHRK